MSIKSVCNFLALVLIVLTLIAILATPELVMFNARVLHQQDNFAHWFGGLWLLVMPLVVALVTMIFGRMAKE